MSDTERNVFFLIKLKALVLAARAKAIIVGDLRQQQFFTELNQSIDKFLYDLGVLVLPTPPGEDPDWLDPFVENDYPF